MKDWEPKGYGKCNRKQSASSLCAARQGEMAASRAAPIRGDSKGCKPYPMQSQDEALGFSALLLTGCLRNLATRSLEE